MELFFDWGSLTADEELIDAVDMTEVRANCGVPIVCELDTEVAIEESEVHQWHTEANLLSALHAMAKEIWKKVPRDALRIKDQQDFALSVRDCRPITRVWDEFEELLMRANREGRRDVHTIN